MMDSVMIIQGAVPEFGSTQQVLECLIDMHNPDSSRTSYWKLILPALWWLFFPATMICWLIMWAWFFGRIVVGILQVVAGEKNVRTAMGMSLAMQKRIDRIFFAK